MKKDNKNFITGKDYISNNSATTFRTCPYKFHLQYREKIAPIKTKASLFFGQCMHQTLDYAFSNKADSDMAKEYFAAVFDEGLKENDIYWAHNGMRKDGGDFCDPETAREYGHRVIDGYFEEYTVHQFELLASEKDFAFNIGEGKDKIEYSGIIDKIVKDENGDVWVLDHKCISQRYRPEKMDNDTQVTGYIVGGKKLGYEIKGAIFDLILKLKVPKFERYYTQRTDSEIADFIENTQETVKGIKSGIKFKSIGDSCSWCDMSHYCKTKELGEDYYINR